MRSFWSGLVALLLLLSGCGGWGGYVYKSDRFKLKVVFPSKWEVWDRSDDTSDYLVATIPDDIPEARIKLIVRPVAMDLSPNELYPTFLEGGGDAAFLPDFSVKGRGTISAKNGEGRHILISYLTEEHRIKGMRAIFPVPDKRYVLEIEMSMPEEDYIAYESDFKKMISLIVLR